MLRQRAIAALQRGDLKGAIRCLKRAIRLNPDQLELYHELAECHWAGYQFNLALQVYEQAWSLAPSSTHTCALAAKKLFGLARFPAAAQWLERAVAAKPGDAGLLTMLGEVYERANRLADAERCAGEALAREPQSPRAARLMAHVERRLGRFDDATRRLRFHLARFPGPDDWRLRYELAAILDRVGEYDAAIQELFHAKEQLRPEATRCLAEAQAVRERQTQVAGLLERTDFENWQAERHVLSKEIAFLCGHPRSGTTLLEQILDAHESVISTDETGVLLREFIAPIVRSPASAVESVQMVRDFDSGQIAEGRAAYLRFIEAHLDQPIGPRLLVDKEPSLTPDLPLPLRLFPEARIIFPLRDPRDVCISYFFTLVPLAASSAAALDLQATCEFCAHSLALWTRWKKILPMPLLEARYETLVTSPEPETRRVMEFLGLPWNDQLLMFHERSQTKGIRTPTYADASQPIYQRAVGRWKNYEKHLAPHLGILAPHLRAFGYD